MNRPNHILIIGSKGMAGHMLYTYFKELGWQVSDIARDNQFFQPTFLADVTDTSQLEEIIASGHYDAVINCVGILNQDAEQHPDKAVFINSYLPHFLAAKLNKYTGRLIHISTDCVFNGKKGGYGEQDYKDGHGFYAQTKALGEVNYGTHLTIRTSIIGPELKDNGIGLLDWFMKQEGVIKGYTKAFWTGLTTLELAKAVHYFLLRSEIVGLVHAVPSYKVCKFDLLKFFAEIIGNDNIKDIEPYSGYEVDKSLVKTRVDHDYFAPDYPTMLEELKSWILGHPDLYGRYLSRMKP